MSSSTQDWFSEYLRSHAPPSNGTQAKPDRRKGYVKDSTSALMLRECSSCKKLKYLSDFSKDKSRVSGLYAACRDCVREKNEKSLEENERLRAEGNHVFETMPDGGFGMVCKRCKILQPVSRFHKNKYAFTGLKATCKGCTKARTA